LNFGYFTNFNISQITREARKIKNEIIPTITNHVEVILKTCASKTKPDRINKEANHIIKLDFSRVVLLFSLVKLNL